MPDTEADTQDLASLYVSHDGALPSSSTWLQQDGLSIQLRDNAVLQVLRSFSVATDFKTIPPRNSLSFNPIHSTTLTQELKLLALLAYFLCIVRELKNS